MSRLQPYRTEQLVKCLDGGLRQDILQFRNIVGIPPCGFTDEKSSYAWLNNYSLPLPVVVKNDQDYATLQEEQEFESWIEKSLEQQSLINRKILKLTAQSFCKKYNKFKLGDEWIETFEQLLLYPEDSSFVRVPQTYSFIKIPNQTGSGYRIVVDPSEDAVPSDFKSQDFANDFRDAKKVAKIEDTLAQNRVYQILEKHTNRRKGSVLSQLVSPQKPWPWMETFHEVNGLLQFFYDLDEKRYASIIKQLDKVLLRLTDEVRKRTLHLKVLQEHYSDQVKRGENEAGAELNYQANLQALYEDSWRVEDKKIAGKVLARADKALKQQLERDLKKTIRKAVQSVSKKKRLNFA